VEWPERLSPASKRNLVVIGNQYSDDILISPVTSEANEPSQAYRQNLWPCVDAPHVNLGTLSVSPATESVSLRPMSDRGRSLRSSPRWGKPTTWRRKAVRDSASRCELSRSEDV